MKKILSIILIVCTVMTMFTTIAFADNPMVQTTYTADPAPMVYNNTLYVYTGNDLDIASTSYKMTDWKCYSTTDMKNWTDHGSVLTVKAFSWANQTQDANAAQVVYNPKDGKFYYFVSVSCTIAGHGGIALGVAVSDSPTGPFKDAIGGPLVTNDMTTSTTVQNGADHSWDDLDPTVFIDDDGKAYLYWGNNACYYARLNDNLTSLATTIGAISLTTQTIGPDYEEAPWIYKRNNLYYLAYASQFPESICYSTSTSPMGPWTYGGKIMDKTSTCSTIHEGIADYKGKSYFFYHNGVIPGGGNYHRAACVEEFTYGNDGSIPLIPMTTAGPTQIEALNPYVLNEAETLANSSGLKTETTGGGIDVCSIDNGDYLKVAGVNFDTGSAAFTAKVAGTIGGTIELHLDSVDGTVVGTLPVAGSVGEYNWQTKSTNVTGATGSHDLYMVFKGASTGNLFRIDNWQFTKKSSTKELTAINTTIDKQEIDNVSGRNTANLNVMAIYSDGTTEDVTAKATATPSQSGIVSVSNGVVTGLQYGSANINISYGGKTDSLYVKVKDMEGLLKVQSLTVDKPTVALSTGRTTSYKVTAVYVDGHTEDVTTKATYTNPNPEIAEVSNGTITAKSIGTTKVNVSFKGTLGEAASENINVTVKFAPVGGGNIAWYRFDEANGATAPDLSGCSNDATITGATGDRVKGIYGNALQLQTANNQYVQLPKGIVSNLNDFTVATWVNPTTMATWARIFDFGKDTNTNMFLALRAGTDNRPRFAIKVNGGSEQQLTAGTGFTLSENKWYHIAIAKSGSTAKMYINGVLAATSTSMSNNPSDMGVTENNFIGKSQWPDPYLNAMVDDFSIYDSALSAEEVKALTITSATAAKVSTNVGTAPVLPGTVAVDYNDGTSDSAIVTWNAVDPASYAAAGTFTVTGKIADSALTATAEVTVTGGAAPKAFTIVTDGKLIRIGGLQATVKVGPTQGATGHDGKEVVLFQLMKGNTPVSIIALSKDVISQEQFTGYFNVDPTDTTYTVRVYVFDSFNNDISAPISLANQMQLN